MSRRANATIPLAQASLLIAAGVVLASAVSGFAQVSAAQKGADSGTFVISIDKTKVGTEKFVIKPTAEGWEADGELQLEAGGKKTSETSVLRAGAIWHPIYYERAQKAPAEGVLTAKFGAEETLLEMNAKGEDEPFQQTFFLPKNDLVVLDTNFFHHFAILLRLYDRSKGADAQPFNVFIPQEALPGTISLQFVAKENVTVGQSARELDHFRAVTDTLQIDIWANTDGAIQRISIPDAKLEVVRQ